MMESPGKFLKKERETRNISLEEISNFTKIKEHHLKAIEEDRYELLPPSFYVKGFLKIYARYLALDPKNIVLQYENYLKSLIPPEPIELQQQALPQKKSVRPWFLFSLIFAVILFTVLLISYPARHPIEKKPKAISSPPILPTPAIQQEVRPPTIYPAQQKEFSGPENLEVKEAAIKQTPAFKVLEASVGRGIERNGLQQFLKGKCSEFTSNNQRGYFFTRIKTPKEGKIAHIWLWEGKEYYRMEIDVKPPAWSVYSYFTFRPQHTGNWKAEARDGNHVLTSLNFRVIQSSGDRSL
jgi:transcriptional regulator with XRE-family HTH domain